MCKKASILDLTGMLKPNPKHKGPDTPFMTGKIQLEDGKTYLINIFKTGTQRIRYGIKGTVINPDETQADYIDKRQRELF